MLGGFAGIVMSLGAGFYEELTYRFLLFGGWLRVAHAPHRVSVAQGFGFEQGARAPSCGPSCAPPSSAACTTSARSGDPFELQSFVFRVVLGLVLTVIYTFRGFAAAVWAHAVYDIWVLVL